MKLPIVFQSLDRIEGKERRSKLLASDSKLYQWIKQLKSKIEADHKIYPDRMDLHIEVTKNRDDQRLRAKTESLHQQEINLAQAETFGYLGRAFVIWTPKVEDYGRTHITVAFFGKYPRPSVDELRNLALASLSDAV